MTMKWSKSPPAVVGHYWWRNPSYPQYAPRLVRVKYQDNERSGYNGRLVCDEGLTQAVENMGGEWSGPVGQQG